MFFVFKQKTAYEMRISDWSSDVCSSDLATDDDLDRALDAAERGFRHWRGVGPDERGRVLQRAAALIRERADRIARIVTLEQGKPLAEAKGEVLGSAGLIDFHAAEAGGLYGRRLMRPAWRCSTVSNKRG